MIDHQLQIQSDLWILDALLTGGDPRSGRGDENRLIDPFAFVIEQEIYYLSDGGYSRVYYPFEEGPVSLDSVSRDEVAVKWDTTEIQNVLSRLNRNCKAYYESLAKGESR